MKKSVPGNLEFKFREKKSLQERDKTKKFFISLIHSQPFAPLNKKPIIHKQIFSFFEFQIYYREIQNLEYISFQNFV